MSHPIISPQHLQRSAFVYVRQSSPNQVRKNQESHRRQEHMVEHVAALGWPSSRIALLDADTGRSGTSLHGRHQFQELLETIARDQAGLIAACELSRLVRDNQDWVQVIRLCCYHGVLLADEHRVYNPADPHDRLMLGIQGTFNEFEVNRIVERMQLCLKEKARRGEQYDGLPPGYICRDGKHCEKHPDPRVQRAIQNVLRNFDRFPSARQLYLHLLEEGFQLPVVPKGRDWRDAEWVTPSYGQILALVTHPAYAGIYVRGRRQVFVTLDAQGHKQMKVRRVPREEWDIFLEGHHEAYIPKERWERNMEKVAGNANVHGDLARGAAGEGRSLLAGLLRCRRCGYRLQARYSSSSVRYVCGRGVSQRTPDAPPCIAFSGADVEALLAEEILEVVGPAGVAAAQRAAEHLASQYQQQRQLLVDRLDALRETEARAAREYKQTDVTYTAARQALGREWNEALLQVEAAQSRLAVFDAQQPVLPSRSQRKQLERLGENVRKLWNHPRASNRLKQELVRVLIEEIVADVDESRNEVVLLIQWSGGHHTELRGRRALRRGKLPAAELKALLDTLRKVHADAAIARALNREGLRSGNGETWTAESVRRYRQRAGISGYHAGEKGRAGWLTQGEAATRLGISPMSVHRLVGSGILPAEQPQRGLPMVISVHDLTSVEVQRAVQSLKAGHACPLPEDPRQLKLF
jgi:DNA invertase Pin-like site-specific DNA recombinase